MKKKDTERAHKYSTEVFNTLKIYDTLGLLKEKSVNKCGIEAYQVLDFSLITITIQPIQ